MESASGGGTHLGPGEHTKPTEQTERSQAGGSPREGVPFSISRRRVEEVSESEAGLSGASRPPRGQRATAAERAEEAGAAARLFTGHISTRAQGGQFFALTGYPQELTQDEESQGKPKAKRGIISEFSRRSRRRMLTSLAIIDHTKLDLPSFVGLTYPDEVLPVRGATVRRHLEALRAAYVRRYGRQPVLWRREYQDRKSGAHVGEVVAHVHLLAWLKDLETEWALDEGGRWFKTAARSDREWLAETWCRIVGSGLEKHRAVTVHPRSWKIVDSWQGLICYVSKYCAKVDEQPCLEGRSWGYWFHEGLPVKLLSDQIPWDSFHAVRRVLRRYMERKSRGRRKPPVFHRWQGLSCFMSERTGERLVRWAWNIGWNTG